MRGSYLSFSVSLTVATPLSFFNSWHPIVGGTESQAIVDKPGQV
jgi:hypothetical protein